MTIKPVDIEELESKAGNIYEAILVAAKRAKQINDELKIELSQRLEPIVIKEEEDEGTVSKDKMNISLDFEKRTKPTETGLGELMNDELEFRAREENKD